MSTSTAEVTDTREIGFEVVRALDGMNIPPKPEYYKVWYSHLESSNDALSTEILSKLDRGDSLDEFFMKGVHERYFELAHPPKQIEKFAAQVLTETNALQQLSQVFDSNAKQFSSELADASQSAIENSEDDGDAKALLSSLVNIAQNAMSRNEELENELTSASKKIENLQTSIEEIARDARTDFLTGLNNRRYFDGAVQQLVQAAESEETPLCMIVSDIDHFKQFNDKWGHPVGDRVLKLVADVLQESFKGKDLLARYGGEEFAIALPNTSLRDAATVAEKVRIAVSKRKLVNRASNQSLGRVTMSFGVAELRESWQAAELFEAADTALFEAKDKGRNQVVSWREEMPSA